MGVQGLWTLLAPAAKKLQIQALEGKRLAVDVSIWVIRMINHFSSDQGSVFKNGHLIGIFTRLVKLLSLGIKPVFVFDGKAPELKRQTLYQRQQQREKRLVNLQKLAERYIIKQLEGKIKSGQDVKEENEEEELDEISSINSDEMNEFEKNLNEFQGRIVDTQFKQIVKELKNHPKLLVGILDSIDDYYTYDISSKMSIVNECNQKLLDIKNQDLSKITDLEKFSIMQSNNFVKHVINKKEVNQIRDFGRQEIEQKQESYLLNDVSQNLNQDIKYKLDENNKANVFSGQINNNKDKMFIFINQQQNHKEEQTAQNKTQILPKIGIIEQLKKKSRADRNREIQGRLNHLLKQRELETIELRKIKEKEDEENAIYQIQQSNEAENHSQLLQRTNDKNDCCDSGSLNFSDNEEDEEQQNQGRTSDSKNIQEVNLQNESSQLPNKIASNQSQANNKDDFKLNKTNNGQQNFVEEQFFASHTFSQRSSLAQGSKLEEKSVSSQRSSLVNQTKKKIQDIIGERDGYKELKEKLFAAAQEQEAKNDKKLTQSKKDDVEIEEDEEKEIEEDEEKEIEEDEENEQKQKEVQEEEAEEEEEDEEIDILEDMNVQQINKSNSHVKKQDSYSQSKLLTSTQTSKIDNQTNQFSNSTTFTQNQEDFDNDNSCIYNESETIKGMMTFLDRTINRTQDDNQSQQQQEKKRKEKEDFEKFIEQLKKDEFLTEEQILQRNSKQQTKVEQRLQYADEEEDEEDNYDEDMQEMNKILEEVQMLEEQQSSTLNFSNKKDDNKQEFSEEQLEMDYQKFLNLSSVDSESMNFKFQQVRQLLVFFGVPFIEVSKLHYFNFNIPSYYFAKAPSEAEAQCAYLEQIGLVDGIITDDSDVFLFGGQNIYRGLFGKENTHSIYIDFKQIQKDLGIDRERLIYLSLFLGSDYTLGIKGVGIVNGMEIVEAFQNIDALKRFKMWANKADVLLDDASSHYKNISLKEKNYKESHKNYKKYWEIPSDFPSERVINAYNNPRVDESKEMFTWGKPNIPLLASYSKQNLGWDDEITNCILKPLVDLQKKAPNLQNKMTDYYLKAQKIAVVNSSRLQSTIKQLTLKEDAVTEEKLKESKRIEKVMEGVIKLHRNKQDKKKITKKNAIQFDEGEGEEKGEGEADFENKEYENNASHWSNNPSNVNPNKKRRLKRKNLF